MKVWLVTVPGYGKYITSDYSTVEHEREIADEEYSLDAISIIVEEREMTQEELDALPEFTGF